MDMWAYANVSPKQMDPYSYIALATYYEKFVHAFKSYS